MFLALGQGVRFRLRSSRIQLIGQLPPSTIIVWPVTNRASSESRNLTAGPISERGFPSLPSGMRSITLARFVGSSQYPIIAGEDARGATQFTRTPDDPHSRARTRASPR